ncbi:rRNA maturation RNase YbeY [Nitrosomonas eutropha]|uniref:Endoribonuclease YbeY n=2 Tax=Nitrosomonadaceae TaxID=206379 RepID=A0ABX5M593_9PROT|nr:rRNA maturation RNase YbeY [Nitrosomonas eutropha]PXV77224.1 putative rRNA maturation factor [Nitrosomonas eutropha]SCX24897.1 probable rRNA maturation factor [Nitrosomonas eutropha]SDW97337.1 probable rRNA maturation factor [Nitrosomonas eutropha]SEI94325.1 probable rRNA maturation factor [Nitrosomonas eutropha]
MPLIKNPNKFSGCGKTFKLTVQFAADKTNIPGRQLFRKWVGAALNKPAEIVIRIVGMQEGEVLNRKFRGKDSATNVLTFVYSDDVPLLGDIVLCAPVISREAEQQNKDLVAHYAHLIVHGVLHLQGYDHISDEDAVVMESLETKIITRLNYPDPYVIQQ